MCVCVCGHTVHCTQHVPVCLEVGAEAGRLSEGTAAVLALVRLLPRV